MTMKCKFISSNSGRQTSNLLHCKNMSLTYGFEISTIINEGRTNREAVEEIKNWLKTTTFPQLPEETLVLFLLSCENEIEATKKTIQAYFRIKKGSPNMFNEWNIDCDLLSKAVTVGCGCSIRAENNTVIHFFRLLDYNYRNFNLVAMMKLSLMLLDVTQQNDPPSDLIVIVDMEGASFMHLTCINLGAIKTYCEYIQEALPVKLKSIHILNANFVFDKCLKIAKIFLRNELLSLIKAYRPGIDMEQFYKECVSASYLPKEYGGDLPSYRELNEEAISKLRDMKEFFISEERIRS